MEIKCITISDEKKVPILDVVTIKEDNILYLNSLPNSILNTKELSKENKELVFTELEPYIYAISSNDLMIRDEPIFKNLKIRDTQLWGDIVILKIVNEKIFGLTTDEIDRYVIEIKDF